jgi:hypothetical protein
LRHGGGWRVQLGVSRVEARSPRSSDPLRLKVLDQTSSVEGIRGACSTRIPATHTARHAEDIDTARSHALTRHSRHLHKKLQSQ